MSLELKSPTRRIVGAPSRSVLVAVTHQGRFATVLIAELDGAVANGWEASRNRAFLQAVETHALPPNAVVLVSPGTLPTLPGGATARAEVIADFPRVRGYLRAEIQAWLIHRLCEVLYLQPAQFDVNLDWARHGVDSAVALEVLADLEDHLRVRLPQGLAESRNVDELAAAATARLLETAEELPWWRSPWVATGDA